jgi:hypothetical protein
VTDELAPISGAASEIARRGGIAPTRFRRFDNDNYFTIDADWIIPALLSKVPIEGRILEPAAGRGHLVHEFRQRGFSVVAIDVCAYEEPLIADIRIADMRAINSLQGFAWAVTNLPYGEQDSLAAHLVALGARDGCGVALLTRAEWIVGPSPTRARARASELRWRIAPDLEAEMVRGSNCFAAAQFRMASLVRLAPPSGGSAVGAVRGEGAIQRSSERARLKPETAL